MWLWEEGEAFKAAGERGGEGGGAWGEGGGGAAEAAAGGGAALRILLYDDKCSLCRRLAGLAKLVAGVDTLPLDSGFGKYVRRLVFGEEVYAYMLVEVRGRRVRVLSFRKAIAALAVMALRRVLRPLVP